jgi:glutathione S-transferase
MTDHYRLLGGPGSPYSLKMRALLRYRRIAHIWIVPRGYLGSGGELERAGKKLIPVLQYPDGGYRADSTPMALDLETRHPGERSIVPPDPAQAFLSRLIEDMGDEFLVQAMFDYRWRSDADQAFCARRQLSGWLTPIGRDDFEAAVERFTRRQTARMAAMSDVGGDTRAILEEFYLRTLDAVSALTETQTFLFGERPALGDFGLFGQLSQCAIDPSAAALMRERAPRAFQWVQSLDDASGIEGGWLDPAQPNPGLGPFIDLAAGFYLPWAAANARAVAAGADTVECGIAGRAWRGAPNPYARKCLTWLRREWAVLPDAARARIAGTLGASTAALAPVPAEDAAVGALEPR